MSFLEDFNNIINIICGLLSSFESVSFLLSWLNWQGSVSNLIGCCHSSLLILLPRNLIKWFFFSGHCPLESSGRHSSLHLHYLVHYPAHRRILIYICKIELRLIFFWNLYLIMFSPDCSSINIRIKHKFLC